MQFSTGAILMIAILSAWVLQFVMSFFQMRRFYGRVSLLRKDGLTAIGMSGSVYKRRLYTVLTVDEEDTIKHAEQLYGWTVFTRLRPVEGLVGKKMQAILADPNDLPLTKKQLDSFRSGVNEIQKARAKRLEKTQLEHISAQEEAIPEASSNADSQIAK